MADHELTLRLNEHRWDALELELQRQGTSIRERMEKQLYELYNEMVRGEKYEQVEAAVADEQAKEMDRSESRLHFAAFHVRQNGADEWFAVERQIKPIGAAKRLMDYSELQWMGVQPARLSEMFPARTELSRDQFEMRTAQGLDSSRYAAELYDVNLDEGLCSRLDYACGWQTFRVADVCAAVRCATGDDNLPWAEKNSRFVKRLEGEQVQSADIPVCIRGDRGLRPDDVRLVDEIERDDGALNFSMEVQFDADKVFGTNVCTDLNDDWVNVYPEYDLERGEVPELLTVFLSREDGSGLNCSYRLNEEERNALRTKMEDYCQEQFGMSLERCQQKWSHTQEPQCGMLMG